MSKVICGALRHALPVSSGDDRARGSSAPFTPEELAAIEAFPKRRIQRIAQGEFADVDREGFGFGGAAAQARGGYSFGKRRRKRDAEVGA